MNDTPTKSKPEKPLTLDQLRAAVRRIPRGKVSTYGAVAAAAGYPGCARQVVWALRGAKGLAWHRVVGAGGRIRLPGEQGLEQRVRLETEGVTFSGLGVRMAEHEHRFRPSGITNPAQDGILPHIRR